ncbi:hypothetical protein H4R34_001245 [Dimargaris verticillata]|uniref:Ribosomal protein S15 n=1 Tax=Dimargaris verticillata TaxID=2761393 RepID=A0A9W8EDY8_9FUNG|nr:hypothetical protein H4R34_001245 [Dimargaris verticillata]
MSKRRREIFEATLREKQAEQDKVDEERKRLNTRFLNSVIRSSEYFATAPPDVTATPQPSHSPIGPKLSKRLDTKDERFLLNTIPLVTASRSKLTPEEDLSKANAAVNQVHKVLDLHNAGSPEIFKWNTQLAIRTFGRKENDTGSPEVQAAIWTLRINSLQEHLKKNPKDKYSCRRYTILQHKRAGILRYLKRQGLERYAKCLKELGLRPDMVEGQILPVSKVV